MLEEKGGVDIQNKEVENSNKQCGSSDKNGNIPVTSPKLTNLARSLMAIYRKHFKPVYLIFDQFEELYVLGSKEEQRNFIQNVKEILKAEQPVKIIIAIREEYLG